MKRLLTAFPLLKKRSFALLLALFFLVTGLTGFLYLPEPAEKPQGFTEDKPALEEALAASEKRLSSCAEEEKQKILEEKAFYESALKFELSPWSSYFASEGLTLYARLLTNGENPDALQKLEQILTERDGTGLYEFCKEEAFPELEWRLLTAESAPQNPSQNAILYDLALLEDSLASGKDLYFGTEKPLSSSERNLLKSLSEQKEAKLASGNSNPIPANRETLAFAEEITACLLSVVLLALAGWTATEKRSSDLPILAGTALTFAALCALVLFFTTLIFAPGTAEAEPMPWGGSLPFFSALLLRMLCRVSGSFPLMLFALHLSSRQKAVKVRRLLIALPALRYLVQAASLLLPRPIASVFTLGNLCDCIFPSLSAYSLRPASPAAGIFLWLISLFFTLWIWLKKEQKITDEKQEISLEKQREI